MEDLPTHSPLVHFNEIRPRVVDEVVRRTLSEVPPEKVESELTAALYLERLRLQRERPSLFTFRRLNRDRKLWREIQSDLLKPSALADRQGMFKNVAARYAEEIAGHFDSKIYRYATKILPYGFNWLLNAASVKSILPWGMTEDVRNRLKVEGEIAHLRKLTQIGTVLLVPTHQSNIDSILIGYVIYLMGLPPFAYGAGLNLFSNPLLSFLMSNLGAYTVDRQKGNRIYKALLKNYSVKILREGIHSIFFPAGGRVRNGAIESKLKLGLLGTALEAQIENLRAGKTSPKVFIVPMTTSYHFVLEASTLIDDHLAEAGKHRFIITDDESSKFSKVVHFFWKLFKSQSGMTVRVGKPLDIFGNFVNEEGNSIGPNGTMIAPEKWLSSYGELKTSPSRDNEYTRMLGARIVERYHAENTVLTSHLVAFTFFESLRNRYPDYDLYRLLRMSLAQRTLPMDEFLKEAEGMHRRILEAADQQLFHITPELRTVDVKSWVKDGIRNLGLFHGNAVLKREGNVLYSEDMNLLYYYRNRLAGYGLSRLADPKRRVPGAQDEKGFLI
ncbi:MAG: 1-acyl-sn-glycerol-3-phosphate acyltransferase [Cryobacterium sp.]|nr:1-acyl-sn-glycerol-3-phosphate acyltransferase [Oligoflexia bacterium]